MQSKFKIEWNTAALSAALELPVDDVRAYFTDGRRVSFIIERRLKNMHPGWQLSPSEKSGYDLVDPAGQFWEVRSLSRGGTYFNPSNQVGKGRQFNEAAFQDKLATVAGFIVTDIEMFPSMDAYVIPTATVVDWRQKEYLNKSAKISRRKFLELNNSI